MGDESSAGTIRNWSKFQHYHTRRPPWIKLYRELLDDQDFHALEPAAAKYLPLVWLIASEDDGKLPASSVLAFRLRVTTDKCAEILESLAVWVTTNASAPLAPCKQDAIPEREREGETEKETEGARKRHVFVPPTPEEVAAYSKEIGWPMDGQAWCDSYAQKGWKVGKNTMKDWRAAVRNWKSQRWTPAKTAAQSETRRFVQ